MKDYVDTFSFEKQLRMLFESGEYCYVCATDRDNPTFNRRWKGNLCPGCFSDSSFGKAIPIPDTKNAINDYIGTHWWTVPLREASARRWEGKRVYFKGHYGTIKEFINSSANGLGFDDKVYVITRLVHMPEDKMKPGYPFDMYGCTEAYDFFGDYTLIEDYHE